MWTKDFKSSPPEEDDVEEDDVEMTGEGSGDVSRVDEDPFEKELRLTNETRNNTEPQQHQHMSHQRRSINWRSG